MVDVADPARRRAMTAGELRQALAGAPDDAPVVVVLSTLTGETVEVTDAEELGEEWRSPFGPRFVQLHVASETRS